MKLKITFLIICFGLALNLQAQQNLFRGNNNYVGSTAPATLVTSGLVLNLDAGNTASYSGSGTTWTDLSSNGNNAALNAAVFTTTAGVSFFEFTNTFASTTVIKSNSMTFSSWGKTASPNTAMMLFNAGNNGSGPDLFFYSSLLNWNTWDADRNPFGSSTTNVDANWHNYTVVNDAATNKASLYIDGSFVGTATYKSSTYTTNLYIGGAGSGSAWSWKGGIASFQAYNRALTTAEVLQNYNATKSRYGL